MGKTEGMISLLESHNPLFISDINGLKNLKGENKSIIFDDVDFSKLTREEILHLVDKERDSDIRVLYDVVKISSDVIKVITSNKIEGILDIKDEAIRRRIREVKVKKPMYLVTNTNNITLINIINTTNNTSENTQNKD